MLEQPHELLLGRGRRDLDVLLPEDLADLGAEHHVDVELAGEVEELGRDIGSGSHVDGVSDYRLMKCMSQMKSRHIHYMSFSRKCKSADKITQDSFLIRDREDGQAEMWRYQNRATINPCKYKMAR